MSSNAFGRLGATAGWGGHASAAMLAHRWRLYPAVRAVCLLLSVLVVVPQAPAQTSWGMEQVMRALGEIDIAESTFVERKESLYLTETLVLSGTISFRAPDKLTKHITEPFEETITIDGDTVIIDKAKEQNQRRYSLAANPAVKTILESVRATLAGDLSGLEDYYSANLWGDAGQWELHLIPRNEQILELIEFISVHGSYGKISRIETLEIDGDRSVLEIEYTEVR